MTVMATSSAGIAYDRRPAAGRDRVLFIHAGVADRGMWEPQWSALADELDLTRVDLRGFGESVLRPSGVLSHAADVLAVLDEAALDRVHVVGASLGAGVAVELALRAPSRVASLLLCPPGGSLLSVVTDDLREFFVREGEALDAGDLDAAAEANLDAWVVGRGRSRTDVHPDVVEQVRRMQLRAFAVAEALGEVEEEDVQPPVLDQLPALSVPCLVLTGAHDLETVHEAARRVVNGIPAATEVVWDGAAHLPSLERPARFAELLRRWVDGLR